MSLSQTLLICPLSNPSQQNISCKKAENFYFVLCIYSEKQCRAQSGYSVYTFLEYTVHLMNLSYSLADEECRIKKYVYNCCLISSKLNCGLPSLVWEGGTVVKNPLVSEADTGDTGSIPGSGRSPGGGHGNPLQHSCLENSMDRGAWRGTAHGVSKSQTRVSDRAHAHTQTE